MTHIDSQIHKVCAKVGGKFVLAAIVQGVVKKKGSQKGHGRRTRLQSLLYGNPELKGLLGDLDDDQPGAYKLRDEWHAKFLLAYCGERKECVWGTPPTSRLLTHVWHRSLEVEALLDNLNSGKVFLLEELRKHISTYVRLWAATSTSKAVRVCPLYGHHQSLNCRMQTRVTVTRAATPTLNQHSGHLIYRSRAATCANLSAWQMHAEPLQLS